MRRFVGSERILKAALIFLKASAARAWVFLSGWNFMASCLAHFFVVLLELFGLELLAHLQDPVQVVGRQDFVNVDFGHHLCLYLLRVNF